MNILFVCTGNTCRSPMAEAIFNKISADEHINATADSAGIYTDGSEVSKNAVKVMKEYNVDISGRKSKTVTADLVGGADLVLTMSKLHKEALIRMFRENEKIYTLSEYIGEDEDVSDPFGGDENVYRQCRDKLYEMIKKVTEKI